MSDTQKVWVLSVAGILSTGLLSGCATSTSTENIHSLGLKAKCREDGVKAQANWKATHPAATGNPTADQAETTTSGGWLPNDEYSYNAQFNTCLWSGYYFGSHSGVVWRSKLILDVYSNKPLIQFVEAGDKQVGDVSENAFERRKIELFGLVADKLH
jgi:hypothetical protein